MKLKDTLKYRNIWLGCAMIWIVLYHTDFRVPISLLGFFKGMGYGGVDICLFASGIGCYYSMKDNSDVLGFMRRRFKRLAPTYWCFLVVWFVCKSFMGNFKLSAVLGNVLGIQSFTGQGNEFNWYISALILMYILAPIFKEIVDRITKNYQIFLMLLLLIAVSIVYWDADKFIIIMTRIPIFYMGMVYARLCCEGKDLKKISIIMLICAMFIGVGMYFFFRLFFEDYLWKLGLYWYPFILITPGLCVILSLFIHAFESRHWCEWIQKVLSVIGEYSFEIYLVHLLIFEITTYLIEEMQIILNTNITWTISLLIVGICCVVLKKMVKRIQGKFMI